MIEFSNPRLTAVFNNWPSGAKRVTCVFSMERNPRKGVRFSRTTTGKPKYTTYSGDGAIVDGNDGRTYILQVAAIYGFIKVMRSDFMDAEGGAVFQQDNATGQPNERFNELAALIKQANNNPENPENPVSTRQTNDGRNDS